MKWNDKCNYTSRRNESREKIKNANQSITNLQNNKDEDYTNVENESKKTNVSIFYVNVSLNGQDAIFFFESVGPGFCSSEKQTRTTQIITIYVLIGDFVIVRLS